MTKRASHPKWTTRFIAMARYELLWNIRKKKFIGVLILAFALATITLVVPVVLNNANNRTTPSNPDYVITTGTGIGSFGFFLFALVTAMNSISGEFESGSIVPLLTKPVSRTTVYLGKIFGAFATLLGAYVLLTIYITLGGYLIYGPQNNLQLVPITLLGNLLSTLVWVSIILAMGSISKSSMLTALLGIGVWFGLLISAGIISVFSRQSWVLAYIPGSGATGYLGTFTSISSIAQARSIATGTDSIASNLITYILNPSISVNFYNLGIFGFVYPELLYSEPLSLIVARSIAVATAYVLVFNLIAWVALKRAQIIE
jgi:ABC-type transport system involved in multi-copper enzyme maturation permease subunit